MTGYAKCDKCGKIYHSTDKTDYYFDNRSVYPYRSHYIKLSITLNRDCYSSVHNHKCINSDYGYEQVIDLCPECYMKLREFLNLNSEPLDLS